MNPRELLIAQRNYKRGQQCISCRNYRPLAGKLGEDYGICTNEASPSWYVVVFEHHSCPQWNQATRDEGEEEKGNG